jgi:hypothetical protein
MSGLIVLTACGGDRAAEPTSPSAQSPKLAANRIDWNDTDEQGNRITMVGINNASVTYNPDLARYEGNSTASTYRIGSVTWYAHADAQVTWGSTTGYNTCNGASECTTVATVPVNCGGPGSKSVQATGCTSFATSRST